MATIDIVKSQLRLTFVTGNDEMSGKPILTTKTFNNVKPSAQPSQLLIIAEALSNLQEYPLFMVERNDNSEINAS